MSATLLAGYLLAVAATAAAALLRVRDHRPGMVLLAAAFLFTAVTQQPFVRMDMIQYFRDWFPVYLHRVGDTSNEFWPVWKLRFAVTGALAIAAGLLQWGLQRWRAPSPIALPDPDR